MIATAWTRPWIEPLPVTPSESLRVATGGHPLVAEALVRRGITSPTAALGFLDPSRYLPAAPSALGPGMARAVSRLGRAIRGREVICVWGDFDVDGQTATALLVSALRDLGARVTFHVPNREREGHGIALDVLQEIIDAGATVILTCDTGISAHEAVAFARTRGIDVIVTDHHDLPPSLPDATAVINPKLLPEDHALAHLPGVGVAYKLAEALYDWARRGAEAPKHLDLAALGIVADLAIVRGDTRYLLQRGLAALRTTERVGLRMLLQAAELHAANLSEEHIGYVIGPRLNAAGRLADATPCVELLTTQDPTLAEATARDLERLNARRKQLTDEVTRGAEAQIAADRSLLDDGCLVLANPYWPPGVIGIVASRMVDQYGLPAVLIASPPGELARGSARSVEGLHISAAIAEQAHLLARWGGHPMAAGITLPAENIAEFRRGLARAVRSQMAGRPAQGLHVDAFLPLGELSLALVDDLARLAPFGPGNPALTLAATRLRVGPGGGTVGRSKEHRVLRMVDEGDATHSVVWWNAGSEEPPEGWVDLAYVARAGSYKGTRELQVQLVALRRSEGAAPVEVRPLEVVDHREDPAPRETLAALAGERDVTVWREADGEVTGVDRTRLAPCETLVIWTAPPGPDELRAGLEATQPRRIHLFARDPGMDRPEPFARRLAGAVKHVLNARGGETSVRELAAATAQSEAVVRLGLRRLVVRGLITLAETGGGRLSLAAGDGAPAGEPERTAIAARLAAALRESAAFRAHLRTGDKDLVVRLK